MYAVTITPRQEDEATIWHVAPAEFEPGQSLPLLQRVCEGYVDVVHDPRLGIDIWVNDEGLLIGMPLNPLATTLAGGQGLAGPAVITGGPDAEGETLGLTVEQVAAIVGLVETVSTVQS